MGGGNPLSARELRRRAAPAGARAAVFRPAQTRVRRAATTTLWLLLFVLLGVSIVVGVYAGRLDADDPVEITAERLSYIEDGEVYVAEGSVVIAQAGRRLSADWMAISLVTRRGVASGRVRLTDADQEATASFMAFDLDQLTGVMFEADIDTGEDGFLVAGRELQRKSEVDYGVREGGFTSCRCPEEDDRDPWRIETSDADLELGGYGQAKNSTVEVLGVPVAWLPWMLFPVKTERETGVLMPELAFGGRSGVQVGLPFFWAARHDVGVIATPTYDKNFGFKGDLEVEYLVGERSGGAIGGTYVRDKSAIPGVTPYGRNRWALLVEHDQFLPAHWRARVDVKAVSDSAFLDDFDDYGFYRRDLFLRSQAFAFRSFGPGGRVGVVGSLNHADDIQNPLGLDRDDTLLNRLPDISARVLPGEAPGFSRLGLVPSLDSQFIYFHQQNDPLFVNTTMAPLGPPPDIFKTFLDAGIDPALGSANDPTFGNGRFEAGEPLLEHGSRLAIHPRLARPVSFGRYAELTPEVGYAEVLYDGSRRGFAERGVASARADLRTRLIGARVLGEQRRGEHEVEPFVRYTLIRTRNQASTPVFIPRSAVPQARLRQLDPENYVLDPSDRIPDANLLAVGVDNSFRISNRRGGADPLRADAWLSFQHDFDRPGAGRLVVGGVGELRGRVAARGSLSWDVGQGAIDEGLADLRFSLGERGLLRVPYLSVGYRFLRVPPRVAALTQPGVNQLDMGTGFRLSDRLLVRYGISYSLDDGSRLAQSGTVLYASRCRCFTIGFDVVEDRTRDVFFRIRYSITGLGDRSDDPFASDQGLFGGERF